MNRKRLVIALGTGVALAVVGFGVIAIIVPFGPGVAGPIPRFTDATASSGLSHTYDGPYEFAAGGGVTVLDCDQDGRPDIYLAGGANPAALLHNEASAAGDLRFSTIPDSATDLVGVNGAYPIDVDSDGVTDLIVLRSGENVALRGLGGCRFERANERWGIDGGNDPTEAFSATWEPGQHWPTLAFGNYVDQSIEDPATWCRPNLLFRPTTMATTGPAYGAPTPLDPSYCALSMLFSDWDRSGRRDLRVSNDRHYYADASAGQEQLWRMNPDAAPRLYTAADSWGTIRVQGMGIGSYDLTGDGLPEIYLTSQGANRVLTLNSGPPDPVYHEIGATLGAEVPHPFAGDVNLPSTAWHPEFADVNNDGYIDLFVSKGNVAEQPDYAMRDPSSLLLGQRDGTFVEATEAANFVDFDRGRGAALVDLDMDGSLDLVESFYGAPVKVWLNQGASRGANTAAAHWLAILLQQAGSNVDAIGAWIEVRTGGVTQRREVVVGGGHAGGQLGSIHFGLGAATAPEVRVQWPDGKVGPWQSVTIDGLATLNRGLTTVPRE